MKRSLLAAAGAAAIAQSAIVASVSAQDAPTLTLDVSYVGEIAGPVSGGLVDRGVFLDNLSIEALLDLEQAWGWRGATAYGHLLNNSGGAPNDYAGTLEGVSNIEVARPLTKLFEAWVAQDLGRIGSVSLGLYDLNRDYYATESAGLLTAPPFGIGSEVAATGPNGPSIFPSTAAGVFWRSDEDRPWYVHAAVVDATAGVIGDPEGIQADFDNGAITLLEGGYEMGAKVSLGAWRYTDDQDDIRETTLGGDPVSQTAFGIYALAEHRLLDGGDAPAIDGFVRVGLSDGDTTDFEGGFQVGAQFSEFLAARPEAQAALGLRYAEINDKSQANFFDAGGDPASTEWGLELTYADPITPWLTLQPDVQLVFNPGGDAARDRMVILGIRAELAWSAAR